jgi:hypothetical protein
MKTRLFAAALMMCLAAPIQAQNLPPDLAMVPSDAVGFLHVRVADIWKHDMMKSVRDTVAAAGPKALAAFEAQMYPNPADIDCVTLTLSLNATDPKRPDVAIIISFKNDIDGEKLRKLYLPQSAVSDVGGKKIFVDKDKDIGLYFPNARHLVAGPAKGIEAFMAKAPGKGEGPLAAALAQASTKAFTLAANIKGMPIPPQAFDQVPPDLRPLAMAERAMLTIDLGVADPVVELKVGYANEAAAGEAEKSLKAAVAMAKQAMAQPRAEMEKKLYENADKGPQPIEKAAEAGAALMAIGGMNRLNELLDHLPISRAGSDLTAKVAIPKEVMAFTGVYTGAMVGLLLPAVQKVRAAASRSQSANNLKQIGVAFHSAHDVMGRLPGAAICDKDGKPLLSWRVAILPYIEQDNLYRQFKLDEPWDSPNNKPLIAKMPKTYASPRVPLKEGETVYKVFVGKDAMFEWKQGVTFAQVPDGLSNTLMAIEGGDPVIWTKPDDFAFDAAKDLPKLDLPGGLKQIYILMGDGSVRLIDLNNVSAKIMKLLVQTNDGQVIPDLDDGDGPRGDRALPKAEATPPPVLSRPAPGGGPVPPPPAPRPPR